MASLLDLPKEVTRTALVLAGLVVLLTLGGVAWVGVEVFQILHSPAIIGVAVVGFLLLWGRRR